MHTHRVVAGTMAVLLSFSAALAQNLVVTRTVPNPIANFDISYIDVTLQGAGPTLFQMQLSGGATGALEQYYLSYHATCESDVFNGTLLLARSGTFGIPPQGITMTSNQFFTNRGATAPSLHTSQERLDRGKARDLILGAGIIPSGRVTMAFELRNARDGSVVAGGTQTIWYDIVAVRYVKLVAPGADAATGSTQVSESFNAYPQFIWNSDLMPIQYPTGSVKFTISVFENPDGRTLAADIPNTRPLWIDTIEGQSSVNYAQYPASGARALEPGHTYYWQVKAILQGPVSREVASEVYAFRISTLGVQGALSPRQQRILAYLAMILGENYSYVMGQLAASSPTDNVRFNNASIDIDRLASLAEEFALGKRMVTHVEIK